MPLSLLPSQSLPPTLSSSQRPWRFGNKRPPRADVPYYRIKARIFCMTTASILRLMPITEIWCTDTLHPIVLPPRAAGQAMSTKRTGRVHNSVQPGEQRTPCNIILCCSLPPEDSNLTGASFSKQLLRAAYNVHDICTTILAGIFYVPIGLRSLRIYERWSHCHPVSERHQIFATTTFTEPSAVLDFYVHDNDNNQENNNNNTITTTKT
jgi:hypothetical protein